MVFGEQRGDDILLKKIIDLEVSRGSAGYHALRIEWVEGKRVRRIAEKSCELVQNYSQLVGFFFKYR